MDFLLGFLRPADWAELLAMEKQRRGLPQTKVVFLNASTLARVAWCPMQAIRMSRVGETSPFGAYLEDRLEFALDTRRITALPSDRSRWLDVAARDVPLDQVEHVWLPDLPARLRDFSDGYETLAGDRRWYEPLTPRIRWHFAVGEHVVVAEPDGLSKSEVFEMKSPGSAYLAGVQRPLAELQADIYGYLFRRPTKLLGESIDDGPLTINESQVVSARALNALETFARLERGWTPQPPRESWKCRKCDVEVGCPISRAREHSDVPSFHRLIPHSTLRVGVSKLLRDAMSDPAADREDEPEQQEERHKREQC